MHMNRYRIYRLAGKTGKVLRPLGRILGRNLIWSLLLLFFAYTALVKPGFLTPERILGLFCGTVLMLPVTLAMEACLRHRMVDFSMSRVAGVACLMTAALLQAPGPTRFLSGQPWNAVPVFLLAMLCGLAAGAASGSLITLGKLPASLVTFAMAQAVYGLGAAASGSSTVAGLQRSGLVQLLRGPLLVMGKATLQGWVPLSLLLGAGVWLCCHQLLGGNRARQRELGNAELLGLFMVTGAAAAATGFLECIRYDMAAGSMCQGLEMKAILAVLLGGATLKDGRGHPWRTAAGTLLVQGINAASGEFFSSRILLLIEGVLLLVLCIREMPSGPSGQTAPGPRRRVRNRRTGSGEEEKFETHSHT